MDMLGIIAGAYTLSNTPTRRLGVWKAECKGGFAACEAALLGTIAFTTATDSFLGESSWYIYVYHFMPYDDDVC